MRYSHRKYEFPTTAILRPSIIDGLDFFFWLCNGSQDSSEIQWERERNIIKSNLNGAQLCGGPVHVVYVRTNFIEYEMPQQFTIVCCFINFARFNLDRMAFISLLRCSHTIFVYSLFCAHIFSDSDFRSMSCVCPSTISHENNISLKMDKLSFRQILV